MRGLILLAGLVLVALSGAAQAQQTQCRWVMNVWTCDQSSRGGVDFGAALKAGRDAVPNVQEQDQIRLQNEALRTDIDRQRAALRAQKADQELRNRVVERLKANDCAGASSLALEGGNIELASQAKAYCATP